MIHPEKTGCNGPGKCLIKPVNIFDTIKMVLNASVGLYQHVFIYSSTCWSLAGAIDKIEFIIVDLLLSLEIVDSIFYIFVLS